MSSDKAFPTPPLANAEVAAASRPCESWEKASERRETPPRSIGAIPSVRHLAHYDHEAPLSTCSVCTNEFGLTEAQLPPDNYYSNYGLPDEWQAEPDR